MSTSDLVPLLSEYRGKLPAFTSYGGYTLIYVTQDNSTLCAGCATEEMLDYLDPDFDCNADPPVEYGTYDEGADLNCESCNAVIKSSYGDPDDEPGKDYPLTNDDSTYY